jgi:hypothetical protein
MSEDFYKWVIKTVCLTLVALGICFCSAVRPEADTTAIKVTTRG